MFSLELTGIHKSFGAIPALDGASIVVRPGTVHALLGENGAGKTTLMRVAFGMLAPDAGIVRVGGAARRLASPRDAIALGVGMVHQHFTVVPAMTVAENVALGAGGARGWRFDARRAAERVREVGERTGLALEPSAMVGALPVAAQQRLEIVKALARDARLLILDEPTAVLAPAEARELLAWLRAFATGERAVVLITHKLRDALAIADDVTVLRHGRTVATVAAAGATEAELAAAMLGEGGLVAGGEWRVELHQPPANRHQPPATLPPVLHARDLEVRDERGVVRLREASFDIAGGEIVGIAAIEGAGQRELLRVLAGRLAPAAGTLTLPERIGFIPEDRHKDALLLDAPLYESVALRGAGARGGVMSWREIESATAALIAGNDVRAPGARALARGLSGGNQQKLVLARELDGAPALVVAENPTRGLDIRATAAVHARLRAARAAGAAVVLYSSDLDEMLTLADRVLAIALGRVHEVPPTREAAGRGMLGIGDR